MCSIPKPKDGLKMLNPMQPIKTAKATFKDPMGAAKAGLKGDPFLLKNQNGAQ